MAKRKNKRGHAKGLEHRYEATLNVLNPNGDSFAVPISGIRYAESMDEVQQYISEEYDIGRYELVTLVIVQHNSEGDILCTRTRNFVKGTGTPKTDHKAEEPAKIPSHEWYWLGDCTGLAEVAEADLHKETPIPFKYKPKATGEKTC